MGTYASAANHIAACALEIKGCRPQLRSDPFHRPKNRAKRGKPDWAPAGQAAPPEGVSEANHREAKDSR